MTVPTLQADEDPTYKAIVPKELLTPDKMVLDDLDKVK